MSTALGKKYFAEEFVVTGGTSSDYLMGDGTLSSTVPNSTIGTDDDLTTSGATVVDDITLTDGVVISHTTRTLTLANLGYTGDTNANNYTHPTYSTTNINTSGSTIVDSITTNSTGHITAMGTRTLTLANLGYTGDTDANNYVLPFTDNSSNWNTAFGWGDHSTEGYISSVTGDWTGTFDGQEGTYYLDYNNFTNTPTIPSAYSHPTHPGDDMSIDTGALTGAVVISDIDLNVTTDTLGHVTDANAAVSTRTLTLANLGFTGDADANNYTHPSYNGDDFSVDTGVLTGATVVSDIDINVTTDASGHVTDANGSVSTRTLTLANLGYTGDTNANEYTHPTYNGDDFSIDTTPLTGATVISDLDINITTDGTGHVTDANGSVNTRTLTLADLGYTGDTDANNTTARTDEEIRDVAAAQWVNGANTTVVYDDAANTIKINAPAGGVVDGSGVQNYLVKWTDSDTLTDSIMHETNDRVGINVIQTNATFAVSKTGDETMLFEPNVSNGGRNQIGNLDMSNGSYVGMNWNALDHQIQTSGVTKLTISSTTIETPNTIEADGFIKDGGTSSEYLMADGSVTTGGGGGSIDGSGTASMITKWTDADTLEDSNMFENASGDILINSTTIGDGALNVYQTTTDPSLHLVTDDAGASAGPIIKMERDSSSPADDDLLGKIEFVGKDSAGGDVVYGQMQGYIFDTTVGGTLRGGFKLQAIQDTTMYTSLETVGSRGYLYNNWYVNDNLIITSVGELSLETGALINLNGSSGTAGQVLSSNGTSMPTWIDTVHSNTTEGGTGSVNIGNMVKISQSDYTGLATKDADTIYMIVG